MNETEFIKFSSELLDKVEDSVREMYNTNHKPSTKGAVVILVADNTDSNTIHYISKDTPTYDTLSQSQKEKIQNIADNKILVMIAWKGLFAYYAIDIDEPINFSEEQIEDTEENEDRILTMFYFEYVESRKVMTDLSLYDEDNTYLEICFCEMLNNIETGNETPELLMTFVFFFTYKELNKIDYVDGKGVIKPENMLGNFNEIEKFNFSFIAGTILSQIYDALDSSCLDENERIDYRLDIDNFITVVNNMDSLVFDKNTKSFDHLAGMANEIRNNANQ